ncbi:unnamed protein product [Onchocerca flexuosa]|uniref:RRM domain-containing protein n=1 Tax=Onchocerca flexuosa TaxID=387005 RepID=A0A183HY20_9BILA|nr:unnamed protein product [Onchocerca flexuosa]
MSVCCHNLSRLLCLVTQTPTHPFYAHYVSITTSCFASGGGGGFVWLAVLGCVGLWLIVGDFGNLPYSAREEDVANFFWQVGPVTSVRIVLDRDTGRPRGFGFCEFETEAAAEQAVGRARL